MNTDPKNNNPFRAPSHPEQSTDTNPQQNLTKATPRTNIYSMITERVLSLLETGTVPWRKPWQAETGMPRNFITKKSYRGINAFLLHAMSFESPFWLTFHQVSQLGGKVRKGEKACPVVFWKPFPIEDTETDQRRQIPLLRYYHVFNLAQCEGLKITTVPTEPLFGTSRPAEIIERMPQRPVIQHGMSKAFYSPSADLVGMPQHDRFAEETEYFATLFHELIHASGHEKRLNRPTLTAKAGFGSNPYCKEELIAEMGAAFLCGQAGIVERVIDNSAAYINGWLEQLQKDKTLIVQAAAQAQKAADLVLGIKHGESQIEEGMPTHE